MMREMERPHNLCSGVKKCNFQPFLLDISRRLLKTAVMLHKINKCRTCIRLVSQQCGARVSTNKWDFKKVQGCWNWILNLKHTCWQFSDQTDRVVITFDLKLSLKCETLHNKYCNSYIFQLFDVSVIKDGAWRGSVSAVESSD